MRWHETIAAIATPPGTGGVGIVRLSGPDAIAIASRLCQRPPHHWTPRRATLRRLIDPQSNQVLDEALLLYMPGPHSYTGEDIVEFQCHGGSYLLRRLLIACVSLGARLADAGEFTKRAFLNGRIDLTQAEAVIDVISSRTAAGLQQASAVMQGKLAGTVRDLRRRLIGILAHIEATIDFPDEIDEMDRPELHIGLATIQDEVQALLETAEAGKIWREGLTIAILGLPNVGKSSLLNALLRHDRAIVTDIPGTTRDTLEEDLNIMGIPVRLVDTAGLRETEDQVERLGIERSRQSADQAQILLFLIDGSVGLREEETQFLETLSAENRSVLIIVNKTDLFSTPFRQTLPFQHLFISARFNEGILDLERAIADLAFSGHITTPDVAINARHQERLLRVSESLSRCLDSAKSDLPVDFIAIDLKDAIFSLGEITGDQVTEEVIDTIFAQFCVGK